MTTPGAGHLNHRCPPRRLLRSVLSALAVVVLAALLLLGLMQLSPRPGAAAIEALFDFGAAKASRALDKHVPPGIVTSADEDYAPGLALHVHRPAQATSALPTIVWVHGGAWISGRKEDIANYAKVLAGGGYAVVGIDYTLAPNAHYPTQIRQVQQAVEHLVRHAARLGLDMQRVVIAGDSAGGQLAAQYAAAVTVPEYARALGFQPALQPAQLRGALLYCGAYDFGAIELDGAFGGFLRVVLWSLFGRKDFERLPALQQASVIRHVTATFPPAFVTAGNADPLLAQSLALADRLRALGVPLDTLFFGANQQPPLAHEYQFDLDGDAGRLALERTREFLRRRLGR
jgi:acetyl esterase